jgi:hypothetical protein
MASTEKWTTVWVVMNDAARAGIYGPIDGVYLTEEAATAHASTGDFKVIEWAASDRFHREDAR